VIHEGGSLTIGKSSDFGGMSLLEIPPEAVKTLVFLSKRGGCFI
jgi:hypothetical protein